LNERGVTHAHSGLRIHGSGRKEQLRRSAHGISHEYDVAKIIAAVERVGRERARYAIDPVIAIGDRADIPIHYRTCESVPGEWIVGDDVDRYHVRSICLDRQP